LHISKEHSHEKESKGCTVALPFTSKMYLKAKEEIWKLTYFTMQKYNLQKILEKEI
jgi:hypothetical protein